MKKMAKVVIDGVSFSGRTVVIRKGKVTVDGKTADGELSGVVEIRIVEGSIENLECDADVKCGDVSGNVKAGMGVECGDVSGDVRAGMSVDCGVVHGNIDAGMGVTTARR